MKEEMNFDIEELRNEADELDDVKGGKFTCSCTMDDRYCSCPD